MKKNIIKIISMCVLVFLLIGCTPEIRASIQQETQSMPEARYQILMTNNTEELQILVNKKLKQGYEPVGGVGVEYSYSHCRYLQAVVKGIEE